MKLTFSKINPDSGDTNDKNKSNIVSRMVIWPLIAGIVIIGFSILLLTLRVIAPSFILMLTGISLIIYWIYITKNKGEVTGQRNDVICTCVICEHNQSNDMYQTKMYVLFNSQRGIEL